MIFFLLFPVPVFKREEGLRVPDLVILEALKIVRSDGHHNPSEDEFVSLDEALDVYRHVLTHDENRVPLKPLSDSPAVNSYCIVATYFFDHENYIFVFLNLGQSHIFDTFIFF